MGIDVLISRVWGDSEVERSWTYPESEGRLAKIHNTVSLPVRMGRYDKAPQWVPQINPVLICVHG
jgi:hypothetical protein